MISLIKAPTLCGIIIVGLSLIYLSIFGPPLLHAKLDSANLWHDITKSSHRPSNHSGAESHRVNHHHDSDSATSNASHNTVAIPFASKPPGHHSSLAMDAADSACSSAKPNLMISAIDGPKLQDLIFIFMQSLEVALAEELLATHRVKTCPPPPVHVHILVPPAFVAEIPPSHRALMLRYPSLEFIPALPDVPDVSVVLRRFKGWSEHMKSVSYQYDRVLAVDMDVVFQRNPFAMPMDSGVELHYFAEWRGLKIGQCGIHGRWFDGCVNSKAIAQEVYESYKPLDRICAGSVYGTVAAMQVYLDLMVEQLAASEWGCNDQAMHIHICYSGLLDEELKKKGIGKAYLVPNEDALLGTVGTTPLVRFNEWGEMLNDKGQVQHVVHQYKHHGRLSEIVWMRYGWLAPVGEDAIPPNPELYEEKEKEVKHAYHRPPNKTLSEPVQELKRYLLANVSAETCNGKDILCSCRRDDCQLRYEWF